MTYKAWGRYVFPGLRGPAEWSITRLPPGAGNLSFSAANPPFPNSDIASGTNRARALYLQLLFSHFIMLPLFPIAIVTRRTLTAELLAKLSLRFLI